jgi:N-acetylmuramoyl-L-alanine amidase
MIILDPGHGFNTAGKRSPVWPDGTQMFEWEFNRDVARRTQNRLTAMNIESIILVKEARDISLRTRVERANVIYEADPRSFLVSIHANAGGGHGWEIFTSRGETESDRIAMFFFAQARAFLSPYTLRTDYVDGDPDKESDFYILKYTKCPAVLTENLFYDNEAECRFLMSSYGRELISKMHAFAISSYIKLNFRNTN